MALVEWSPDYSVQVQEFDLHHQKLIGYINELNDSMRQGKGKAQLPEILRKLVDYTGYHFEREEELMEAHHFQGLAAHKEEHRIFVEKIRSFQRDFSLGRVALSLEILHFLRDWLIHHILETDKEYGPFLKDKGVS